MKPTVVAGAPDFRLLFESSPDLYLVLAPDFAIVAASDAYVRATASTRSEILGRKVFSVFPEHPEKRPGSAAILAASLERVVSVGRTDTIAPQRYCFLCPDSEYGGFEERVWRVINTPLCASDGTVRWILHKVEDVTELVRLKQAQSDRQKIVQELRDHAERMEAEAFRRAHEVAQVNRQLQKTNKELAQLYEKRAELDRLKTVFFTSLSEEFRTPLNANAPEFRLSTLVSSVLDFARVQKSHLELSLVPTDLPELTSRVVESFRTQLEQAGLELIVDCPSIPDQVHIDSSVWENVVRNLVSNAFNTTFEGSIAVSIELQSDEVVVLFRDTGPGIPPGELHRIFEPFHKISGVRRTQEGNTIGLALVPELVRHLGGAIDVWSEEGSGTTFKVTFTLSRAPIADPSSLEIEAALAAPPYSTSNTVQGHILLVDDSASTRGYLYRILAPSYRVSVAENGGAALAAIRKEQPDLILSDMVIPVLDGAGLVRSLREDPQTATIPVILLSSRVGEDGIGVCPDVGADGYLVGPVSAGNLLATVRAQLQLSRVRRAAADAARELAKSRLDLVRRLETHQKDWESSSTSMSSDEWPRLERIADLVDILEKQFGKSLDSGSRRHLSSLASAAREMDDLVNNLASFSRVSQMEMKKTSINLRRLVQEVVGQLDEPGCPPSTEWILGDLPCVIGDEAMLRLALVNLISNALKFSSRRSRRRIEIGGAYSSEGCVVFHIRDNGIGFNMDYADRLFGVFQRLHPREEFEGIGIGLAIVDRILQRHDGQVWATGTEGEGATFYCSLPTPP